MNKKYIAIVLLFTALFIGYCYSTTKSVSAKYDLHPIMELYYSNADYQYVISTVTDVVYIRCEVSSKFGLYYLVPMYKSDGTLMTGVELKGILDGGNG